jgi:hypothetical protein
MNATDNKSNGSSITANLAIQVIQPAIISRYFAAAGLVIILYDTMITIEDEVSECLAQPFESHSLVGRSAWCGQGHLQLQSYFTTSIGTGRLHP